MKKKKDHSFNPRDKGVHHLKTLDFPTPCLEDPLVYKTLEDLFSLVKQHLCNKKQNGFER